MGDDKDYKMVFKMLGFDEAREPDGDEPSVGEPEAADVGWAEFPAVMAAIVETSVKHGVDVTLSASFTRKDGE